MSTHSVSSRISTGVSVHSTTIYASNPKRPPRHRQTTYRESLQHLLKANVGSAVFAMGDAFKNGGLVLSPVLLFVLAIICVHCMHLLLESSEMIRDRLSFEAHHGYAEIVEISFLIGPEKLHSCSDFMKKLVNFFLSATQLGFCCVYIVFVAESFYQLFNAFGLHINIIYVKMIITIPILISCLLLNLKILAPISTISNLFMIVGIGITLYYICIDLPPISERNLVTTFSQSILFLGTTIYGFEGIGLVVPLKNEMIHPEQFGKGLGVLNVGMTIMVVLFIIMGFTSYLKYGETVLGSVSLNIPQNLWPAQLAKFLISLAIMGTFPLQFYLPVQIIKQKIGRTKHPIIIEEMLRTILVVIVCTLAIFLPFLNLIISLIGVISSSTLSLTFPAMLSMLNAWSDEELSAWILIKGMAIVLFALFIFFYGSYEAVSAIVMEFQTGSILHTSNDTYVM